MAVAPNPRCRLLHRKRLFHRHRRLRLVLTRAWMAPAPLSSKCVVHTKLPCLTARSPAPPRSQVLRSSRSAIPRPRPITRSSSPAPAPHPTRRSSAVAAIPAHATACAPPVPSANPSMIPTPPPSSSHHRLPRHPYPSGHLWRQEDDVVRGGGRPDNPLLARPSLLRPLSLLSDGGMLPWKELKYRSRNSRL
ncbi:formin-like protein 5 [Zea mays]|uniref:formin-like protein 5 n=1 Tax=Zea mays TaxID=4577 RepID=UPI0009AA4292|nr:formin-like protein 5 [Zea mays]|eukprot:XP_020395145.1 formin-like protein 5 [Zea mays]